MFRSIPNLNLLSQRLPLLLAVWLGLAGLSSGIVLLDTDNASANTTAPTGIYQDSGWGFQGEYGGFLGTMIGQQYFITAQHFGVQGSTFVSTAEFNGVADVTLLRMAARASGTSQGRTCACLRSTRAFPHGPRFTQAAVRSGARW
jgi:hypothetical protein